MIAVYACLYVCVCTYMCVCMYGSELAYVHVYVCVCVMCVHVHVYLISCFILQTLEWLGTDMASLLISASVVSEDLPKYHVLVHMHVLVLYIIRIL